MKKSILIPTAICVASCLSNLSLGSISVFAYFDSTTGIKSESRASGYPAGVFEVNSYSIDYFSGKPGAADSGQVTLKFTIKMSETSIGVLANAFKGASLGMLTLGLYKNGALNASGPKVAFREYQFQSVSVSKASSTSSDESPEETFIVSAPHVKISYKTQGADGTLSGTPVVAG